MVSNVELQAWRRARSRRYRHVPTVRTMRSRARAVYLAAPDNAREVGALWYPRFAYLADILAERYSLPADRAAGVLAWTSPRVSVRDNVRRSRDVLAALDRGLDPRLLDLGLLDHVGQAVRVAQGDLSPLSMDSGALTEWRKVRSFWRNITGDADAVTLDVWTLRAVGIDNRDWIPRGGAYVAIAGSIRLAAEDLDVSPRDLQATLWAATRPDDDATEWEDLLDIVHGEPVLGKEALPL